MLPLIHAYVVPAALQILPPQMTSVRARAMLLAIALQESKCEARRQLPAGPARGFWQFEAGGGVRGVLSHEASRDHARNALVALCYPRSLTVRDVHATLEHNDVLACAFARLLLWTLPGPLSSRLEADVAWRQYLDAWRPGKPHQRAWGAHYRRAWALVEPNESSEEETISNGR